MLMIALKHPTISPSLLDMMDLFECMPAVLCYVEYHKDSQMALCRDSSIPLSSNAIDSTQAPIDQPDFDTYDGLI